jgi:hypothetical protein
MENRDYGIVARTNSFMASVAGKEAVGAPRVIPVEVEVVAVVGGGTIQQSSRMPSRRARRLVWSWRWGGGRRVGVYLVLE